MDTQVAPKVLAIDFVGKKTSLEQWQSNSSTSTFHIANTFKQGNYFYIRHFFYYSFRNL